MAARAQMLTLRALKYLGEECVKRVRDRSGDESWYDQTGNLRSSVGYMISHNGIIVDESEFNKVKDGGDGVLAGKELAGYLAKNDGHEWALVVVAGMNYAAHVEAMDNKDVLASTELWARERAPKMMENLKKQIARVGK